MLVLLSFYPSLVSNMEQSYHDIEYILECKPKYDYAINC